MESILNNIATKEIWTYEAKCRKCGNVNEFVAGSKNVLSQQAFSRIVIEQMAHPFMHPCPHCPPPAEDKVMKTVHDVISANL